MIIQQIPRTARFIQTSTEFLTKFDLGNGGNSTYDFSIIDNTTNFVDNTKIPILDTDINSVYFINNMSVGGSIDESDYLDAINIVPELSIRRKVLDEIVFSKPIPIVNYYKNQDVSTWFKSDKLGDGLTGTLTGILNQPQSLVGVTTIKIFVTFGIFAIDANTFNQYFNADQKFTKQGTLQ